MRAVVQRVRSASVRIDGEVVGTCGKGLLVLVAAHRDDTPANATKMADRLFGLRIFNDAEGKMNLALKDLLPSESVGVLLVSNFTVYGDAQKGRRPSFIESAPYEAGEARFAELLSALQATGVAVETGVFGADMQVELVNDGPVTLIVDA